MRDGEFFVQEPTVFAFIDEVHSVLERESDTPKRLASLRRPYQDLLEDKSWLPDGFRQINPESGMGGGIASWLLYQNSAKDLSLFSLVVPPSVTTPIHNHLSLGLGRTLPGRTRGRRIRGRRPRSPTSGRPGADESTFPPGFKAGRILRADTALQRRSPGQNHLARTIDQPASARQRYRMCRSTEIRPRHRSCRRISIGLEQQALSRICG